MRGLWLLILPAVAGPSEGPAAPTDPVEQTPVEAAPAPEQSAEASAQDGAASAPFGGLELAADLRAEYLAGQPIAVGLTARNGGAQPVALAALDARPWLARFALSGPGEGAAPRVLQSPPPEADPGTSWTVTPRGQRQFQLEIPSSASLAPGAYTLIVTLQDGAGGELALAEHAFTLAPPTPVAGTPWYEPGSAEANGHQIAWVHRAAEGYDLYLHHADGGKPEESLGEHHLLHLDAEIDPVLSMSRPQEGWDRYIYWSDGDRALRYARLQGDALRGAPGRLELPYPEHALIGRGATDADGGLHAPIWIPAPSGKGGEIRVASIRDQGGSRLRSVARMGRAPDWVEAGVDATGALHLLVASGGGVIDYALPAGGELPAKGQRIVAEGAPILARFGDLPPRGDEPGGLAIFMLFSSEAGLEGRWYSQGGRELHRFPAIAAPEGAQVIDALPVGYDAVGLLSAKGQSELVFSATGAAAKSLPWLSGASLCVGAEGAWRLWAIRGGEGAPVAVRYAGG